MMQGYLRVYLEQAVYTKRMLKCCTLREESIYTHQD